MPEITLHHTINTDEDTYWEKFVFDPEFNKKLYTEFLKVGWTLVDQKEDDARLTRRVEVVPDVGNLPASMRKVIGERLSYTEDGVFDKKSRRYTFKVTPNVMPDKTKVSGDFWVEKAGDKKITRYCRVSVDVKVMFVGSMVEEKILTDLRSSYDKGTDFTNDYIAKHGL